MKPGMVSAGLRFWLEVVATCGMVLAMAPDLQYCSRESSSEVMRDEGKTMIYSGSSRVAEYLVRWATSTPASIRGSRGDEASSGDRAGQVECAIDSVVL